jgi:hypothetical protein
MLAVNIDIVLRYLCCLNFAQTSRNMKLLQVTRHMTHRTLARPKTLAGCNLS